MRSGSLDASASSFLVFRIDSVGADAVLSNEMISGSDKTTLVVAFFFPESGLQSLRLSS